jgi:glycosyltransferase involved in cell wall biosynthesis
MKAPADIVVLAVSDWGVVRSNPDYTVLDLARRGHRVLVVEPLMSVAAAIRVAGWQKQGMRRRYGLRQVDERLFVYAPPPLGLPGMSRSAPAARMSARIAAALIARQCRTLGMPDPIVWSFAYNMGRVLRHLPARLRIYECGDDDSALARSDAQRKAVRALEEESCRSADLVFCVTEELARPRRTHNAATYEVPCAADVAFFSRATSTDLPVAAPIAALPKPVIGYFGGLDPWKMDVGLLTAIARSRPDWSIALVGYVWFGFDPAVFQELPNIHVLGPQSYGDLPSFIKGMDVCLLPFPYNAITRNGDALKAYEYLAAGKPVVGRNVPVMRRLGSLVRIAEDAPAFIAAIEDALADTEQHKAQRRAEIAEHDWSVRVARKLALIGEAEDALSARMPRGAAVLRPTAPADRARRGA